MTTAYWLLPAINAKDLSPRKTPLKGFSNERKPVNVKYDHWGMLQDKLSGMSWAEVGAKHGVKGESSKEVGRKTYLLCKACKAANRLTPEEVSKIFRRMNT